MLIPLFDTSKYQNLVYWTLRSENLELLGLLLNEFDVCPLRFIGLNDLSTQNYKNVMQQAIRNIDINSWRKVRAAYTNDQVALKAHRFWNNLIGKLNSTEVWDELILNCSPDERMKVEELQLQWQQHKAYATYSSSALVYLIQVVIPGLERFVSIAQTELAHTVKPADKQL